MSFRPTARPHIGAVPAPCLEFRGARLPELLELRRLLAEAGLHEARIAVRPASARCPVVSVPCEAPLEAAVRSWQLWTLPTALETDLPGLAATIVTARAAGSRDGLRAALDAAATPAGAKLQRIRAPLAHGVELPLDVVAAVAEAAVASEGGTLATLTALRRNPRAFDLLVAREGVGAATAATLRRIAGPGLLATELRLDGQCASVRARPGATGLLLGTIRALESADVPRVPRTLLDALLRALEDGVTHAGLAHLAPRAPCASDGAFLAAVRDRLGERPRWLADPLSAVRPSTGERAPIPAPVRVLRPVAAVGPG